MISVEEAQRKILESVHPMGGERVSLLEGNGRVLAEAIYAPADVPPWDNSAMDGYAVRSEDVSRISEGSCVLLHVVEEIRAGQMPTKEMRAGESARIMTGAPLPPGADSVVRVEDTAREGENRVRILRTVAPGENVRPRGEDIRKGECVIGPGVLLGPAQIGILASMGRSTISVFQQPRVSILSTGDELLAPDEEMRPGKIRDSNSYALACQVREAGGVPLLIGIAPDTKRDLEEKFEQAVCADVIIACGGMSVGEYDFVKEVLAGMGADLVFWKVSMKPGKPLAFGTLKGKPLWGLPGNPVSAMVTFEQCVRPALRKICGFSSLFRQTVEATLEEDLELTPGRRQFLRGVIRWDKGRYRVRTTGDQGSGLLTSMVRANAFIIVPEDIEKLRTGDLVSVQLLS